MKSFPLQGKDLDRVKTKKNFLSKRHCIKIEKITLGILKVIFFGCIPKLHYII
jgi:hypothetical protein